MRTHRKYRQTTKSAGKTRVTKPRLVVILHLIGWENGASFLAQSQSEVKQKLMKSWISFDPRLKIILCSVESENYGFASLSSVISRPNASHFLNHTDTNHRQSQSQSGLLRFPALPAVCLFSHWVRSDSLWFFFALIGRCDSFGFSLTTDSIKVRCDLSAAFSNYIKGSFQRNIWFEERYRESSLWFE